MKNLFCKEGERMNIELNLINEFVVFLVKIFPISFIIGIFVTCLVVLHKRDNEKVRNDFK